METYHKPYVYESIPSFVLVGDDAYRSLIDAVIKDSPTCHDEGSALRYLASQRLCVVQLLGFEGLVDTVDCASSLHSERIDGENVYLCTTHGIWNRGSNTFAGMVDEMRAGFCRYFPAEYRDRAMYVTGSCRNCTNMVDRFAVSRMGDEER